LINSRIAKHLNLQVYYGTARLMQLNNNFPLPRSRLSLTKSFFFWEAKGARRSFSETQYRLNNVDTLKVCFMSDLWQRAVCRSIRNANDNYFLLLHSSVMAESFIRQ